MSVITPHELIKRWKTNKFARVYLFAEQNTFEKEHLIASMTAVLFPDGLSPFDHECFSLPDASLQEIVSSTLMVPFGGKKRVVRVKGVDELPAAPQRAFAEHLSLIPDSTVLLLESGATKRDTLKSPLGTAVDKIGDIIFCWKPRIDDMPRIITVAVRESGKNITADAARLLAEESGDDQGQLMHEIDILLLYAAQKTVIDIDDVAAICGQTSDYNVFDLRDTIQIKNAKRSVDILQHLLHERVEPVQIVNSIYQTYRRMLLARLMRDTGDYATEEIERRLTINAYYEKHFFSDISSYSIDELREGLEQIAATDEAIKTGGAQASGILTTLLLRLAGFDQFLKLQSKT